MNVDEALAAYRHEIRRVGPVEQSPTVTRRLNFGTVSAFDLDGANLDHVIAEEIARFRGRQFEWKAYSFDRPADLVDRLRNAGFEVGAREALVVYDLRDGLTPFDAPTDWEVRKLRTMDDLATFRTIAEQVFKKDYSHTTGELADAIAQGRSGHDAFVASLAGTPASIGRLYTSPDSLFGGLYGGGTLETFRGRGGYRAVVAARAVAAEALGARYLVVDALPTSLPILLKLGFFHIADTWPCVFRGE